MPTRLQTLIRTQAKPEKKSATERFFKTGPGEYGFGDKFLGGFSMGELRQLAVEHIDCSEKELLSLMQSPFHEERMVGVLVLVLRYQQAQTVAAKAVIVHYYLANRAALNNWDLVDASAYQILGDYCLLIKDDHLIKELSRSERHWDRRLAIVATWAWIRVKKLSLTLQLARQNLSDPEDLMAKASGWMLRELGKRDPAKLRNFIKTYGRQMPRTMLRYAIEKFSKSERDRILRSTK